MLIRHFNSSPHRAKILEWGRLITIMGSAQVLVQGLGSIGGIIVIRLLSTQDYALYTLANTMVGTMLILADGGIATGVMSEGGRVWQDRKQLGTVLATGFDLRRKFAVVSLLIALPVMFYLLRHHGASWLMTALITAALIPTFFTVLSGTLLEIAPKLHQNIIPMQRYQAEVSIGRVLLLYLSLLVFPLASIAVLANSIPQIWSNWRLRKLAFLYIEDNQKPDPQIRREILNKVKRLLPDTIYYCVTCQFTIWLISLHGSTAAVAQLGALGRLAVALGLFSTIFSALILPRYARLSDQTTLLFRYFTRVVLGLIAISVAIVIGTWLLSGPILWVLGKQYTDLGPELVLMMIGKCISMVASFSFLLCTSRGWVINPAISITISVLSIGIGLMVIDITTLRGIFKLDIIVAIGQLIMHVIYGLGRIKKLMQETTSSLLPEASTSESN
jgi:O-antigen/teichoic acid export membrane protein